MTTDQMKQMEKAFSLNWEEAKKEAFGLAKAWGWKRSSQGEGR